MHHQQVLCELARPHAEGLAPVQTSARPPRYGFVDRAGKLAIKPQFDAVRGFNEGLAVALIGRQYGFIDKRGLWVVQPRFEKVSSFAEGLALVVVNVSSFWSQALAGGLLVGARKGTRTPTPFRALAPQSNRHLAKSARIAEIRE